MKKIILLFFYLLCMQTLDAQFNIVGHLAASNNMANNFNAFQTKYNAENAADLKGNLGNMDWCMGYGVEANYRIMGLSSALSRNYFHSSTSAKFNNGAKRIIDFDYKLTTVLIGAGFDTGEQSEMRIEVGMVHSVSDLYSYVKFPSGELDYHAGGASHQSTHTNIGVAARVAYFKNLSSRWFLFSSIQYTRINANNIDVAPALEYMDTRVTHTYFGLSANLGLGCNILLND